MSVFRSPEDGALFWMEKIFVRSIGSWERRPLPSPARSIPASRRTTVLSGRSASPLPARRANALVLGSSQTLTFCTRETAEDGEESDPWTEALLPVRERMVTLLADRSKRLRKRLADVLLLAAAAQELLDQEKIGKLPAPGIVLAAEAMGGGERGDIPDGAARFKRTGYFGSCLADAAGPGGENRSDSGVGGPSGAYGSVFHLSLSAQSGQ